MSGRSISRRAAALAVVAVVSAISCASVPSTNYYVLGLPRESGNPDGEPRFAYSVSIAPFESEPAYLRKKIIWRSDTNRLGYYSYEKWAALPAEMLRFRLYERAHEENLFESIHTGGTGGETDLILGGRIIAFEELDAADGPHGNVEVEFELADREGTVIWSGIESHAEPAAERNVEAVVKAIAHATEVVITNALVSVSRSLEEMQRQNEP